MTKKRETKKLNKSEKKTAKKKIAHKEKNIKSKIAGNEKKKVKRENTPELKREGKLVCARAKYLPGSARKARLVIDVVRNMNALEAIERLNFLNKRAALPVRKVIESAIANAYNNFEMEKKDLKIVKAFIDDAPLYKRGRAGSKGRYKKILKRNCHITIYLKEEK